jgi:MoaA/NifB/PqqE/SkfB family radical SAM enzyme
MLAGRRWPVSLVHFLTNRCNAHCPHCFIDFDGAEPGRQRPALFDGTRQGRDEMSLEEIDRLTGRLGPCLANVNLTGGEPFLRTDLTDIARMYFRNAGVRTIFITSNGSLPDRILPFAEALRAEFPHRQAIFSFSLDDLPDAHDATRGIPGLFEKAIACYRALQPMAPTVLATIAITISHTNHAAAEALYEHLVKDLGVRSITIGPARDEGVYRMPDEARQGVLETYFALHERLDADMRSGRLDGYDRSTLAGRLLNAKNRILFSLMRRTLRTGRFISPCRAAALFGIIAADGTVYPCEMLDRPLGNLRDYDCDFVRLWQDASAREARRWIRQTRCRCTYECAWTFNILGNWRYQPALLLAAMGL